MRPRISLVILAFCLAAGCNRTATPDPFAREEDPNVELQGLAVVVAGAVGQAGMAFSDTAASLTGNGPRHLEWARTLADPDASADELREAMLGLVRYDYGRKPPYTDAYAQFAEKSPDALVRASALRALNISRSPKTELFTQGLIDEAAAVRLEAAKALANVPDPSAAPALAGRAVDPREQLDVRIAAADALKHYEDPEPMRALVSLLESDDFGLVWQARRSLVTATGEDHGFDPLEWRKAMLQG
jgi:hypothetical protein